MKHKKYYSRLIKLFVGLSCLGVAVLLYTGLQHNDPSQIAFPLIAFIVSVAALILTTLQSLSIAEQVRITEKAARLVDDSSNKIEMLVKEEGKLEKEIRQDIALDHEIIAVLKEFGIGENHEERRKVANTISNRLK